jgi:hypothetical protein
MNNPWACLVDRKNIDFCQVDMWWSGGHPKDLLCDILRRNCERREANESYLL